MDIRFTDEQAMLQNAMVRYLKDNYDFDTRRTRLANAIQDNLLWNDFASTLGILGATFPQEMGGLGGGAVETMIIQEALGFSLVIEPYLETVVMGGALLRSSDAALAPVLQEGIIDGSVRLAFAAGERNVRHAFGNIATSAVKTSSGWALNGSKTVVVGAPGATHWIVLARTSGVHGDLNGLSLFIVDPTTSGIDRRDYRLIDERPASDLFFQNVALPDGALLSTEGKALPIVDEVIDEATAALCSEAVGVLRRMLADTIDYTKQRKQFGQSLSRFQVLQHRLVDMHMHVEQAAAAALLATLRLTADRTIRSRAVSAAKATVSRCARFVGQNAVQLHGAMGLMDEVAVSHYFKRATVIENQFGSEDFHRARYTELSSHPVSAAQ
nr:acyl-CoA dehydrogenase family protein [Sphingomonas sp. CDS-1]